MAKMPMGDHLRTRFKAPNPALNIHRRAEGIATDTVFADTPAIDGGCTCAQFFVGIRTLVIDVYGMRTERQFVTTLEDVIRDRGAPERLISDRAQVEIGRHVQDILRTYMIGDWQSEPHCQHQNPAERRYQVAKRLTNTILNRTGAPASMWLLALQYAATILNLSATQSLQWRIPLAVLTGQTPDTSLLLQFRFWDPVWFQHVAPSFPSDSPEIFGRFVGFAPSIDHQLTFRIFDPASGRVLAWSVVRPAPFSASIPSSSRVGEDSGTPSSSPPSVIRLVRGDLDATDTAGSSMELISPEDLIGRTFLMEPTSSGERHRATVIEELEMLDRDRQDHPRYRKFLCKVNGSDQEEIVSYNEILRYLESDREDDGTWKFCRITAHEGPLTPTHPSYNGSMYNVMVEWEDGTVTLEPLAIIGADDPVSCAMYAEANDLLAMPGWKRFRKLAKRKKVLMRLANQAKLRSFCSTPKYKYGVEVPRDYSHAMELDKKNGNTKWADATALEFKQLNEYQTFTDMGKNWVAPKEYKRIKVHLVYDCKHNGRRKAQCVADGHLTDVPVDSVYSGVVSLRGLRMVLFLAELNQLEV